MGSSTLTLFLSIKVEGVFCIERAGRGLGLVGFTGVCSFEEAVGSTSYHVTTTTGFKLWIDGR
jgi:hypothetical protein